MLRFESCAILWFSCRMTPTVPVFFVALFKASDSTAIQDPFNLEYLSRYTTILEDWTKVNFGHHFHYVYYTHYIPSANGFPRPPTPHCFRIPFWSFRARTWTGKKMGGLQDRFGRYSKKDHPYFSRYDNITSAYELHLGSSCCNPRIRVYTPNHFEPSQRGSFHFIKSGIIKCCFHFDIYHLQNFMTLHGGSILNLAMTAFFRILFDSLLAVIQSLDTI